MKNSLPDNRQNDASAPLLWGGVLASAAASVCCIGPLLLLATGISGAWMSRLMVLEPYYPLLAAISLGLIGSAGWRLFQPRACAASAGQSVQARPALNPRIVFALALSLALILLSSEYWVLLLAN